MKWMTALQVKEAFEAVGLRNGELVRFISWACASRRLVSTGFRQLTIGDDYAREDERENLNTSQIWRFFSRAFADGQNLFRDSSSLMEVDWNHGQFNYRIEHDGDDERSPVEVECWINWQRGEASCGFLDPEDKRVQDVWRSILFDRNAVETLAGTYAARSNAEKLQDYEVEAWILSDCQTQNSKVAWSTFKSEFGKRAPKKINFEGIWKTAKGNPTRGRPTKTVLVES